TGAASPHRSCAPRGLAPPAMAPRRAGDRARCRRPCAARGYAQPAPRSRRPGSVRNPPAARSSGPAAPKPLPSPRRHLTRAAAVADDASEASLGAAVAWALTRDLKLALRSRGELGVQLLFYVIVVSLFPLATSPERTLLMALGPGVLWVAALLAALLSLPR